MEGVEKMKTSATTFTMHTVKRKGVLVTLLVGSKLACTIS